MRCFVGITRQEVAHPLHEQGLELGRVGLVQRGVLQAVEHFCFGEADCRRAFAGAAEDYPAQDVRLRRGHVRIGQFATAARGAGAVQHFALHHLQDIGLQRIRHAKAAFDHLHQQLQLGHRTDLAVGFHHADQPGGILVAGIAARRRAVQHMVAQRFDEEIGPRGRRVGAGLLQREDRFGFLPLDQAIGPPGLAQVRHFGIGHAPIAGGQGGNIGELRGHAGVSLKRISA